jgi:hypothetical protein
MLGAESRKKRLRVFHKNLKFCGKPGAVRKEEEKK